MYNITAAAAKSFQSCPTLCDPIDGSPPGSPVPGILQAKTLEWAATTLLQSQRRTKEPLSVYGTWRHFPKSLSVTNVSRQNGANDGTRDIMKETQTARMDLENTLHLWKLKKCILHHKEGPFLSLI